MWSIFMHKFQITTLLALTLLCASALPIKAALVGSPVTGSLQFDGGGGLNVFDPILGFVPAGYLNSSGTTVTISSSAVEFGFDDFSSLVSADFTDGQLVLSDHVEATGPDFPFTMSFADPRFAGATISKNSDTFPLTYSLSGDVLTVNWAGADVTAGQNFIATFGVATSTVPEPSTFGAMLLSGLAALSLALVTTRSPRIVQFALKLIALDG
jgi:hypothetical protein